MLALAATETDEKTAASLEIAAEAPESNPRLAFRKALRGFELRCGAFG
jgi:hypothetical protein